MEKITGRSADLFPWQIEELMFRQPELGPQYLLELSKDGPLDRLTVLVEIRPGARDRDCAAILQHNITSYIGITAHVRVVPISSIERSIGKAKRVVDKRTK